MERGVVRLPAFIAERRRAFGRVVPLTVIDRFWQRLIDLTNGWTASYPAGLSDRGAAGGDRPDLHGPGECRCCRSNIYCSSDQGAAILYSADQHIVMPDRQPLQALRVNRREFVRGGDLKPNRSTGAYQRYR